MLPARPTQSRLCLEPSDLRAGAVGRRDVGAPLGDGPSSRANVRGGGGARTSGGAEDDRSARLTRADWLTLALDTLVREGIDQVKIQTMARRLNVARSSFYWHFESYDALLQAMLDDWLQKNTGPIIERAMRPATDINYALIAVSECWLHNALFDPTLDVAVRLWARRSDLVRKVVLQADTMRTEALAAMFQRHGYDPRDALIRARTIYFTQIGQFTLEDIEAPPLRARHAVDYIRIFTGQPLSAGHEAALAALFA